MQSPDVFIARLDLSVTNSPSLTWLQEIHYDNPQGIENVLDSSGVRFYYKTTPRQYEMGMLELADPRVTLGGESVGAGLTQHVFDCPSSCMQAALSGPITILREALHMHRVGASMKNELIRDGEVVHTGQIDFWDFDSQGNPPVVQEPFQVLPGDAWRTTCNYRTSASTRFGTASDQEMCMSFIVRCSLAGLWCCLPRYLKKVLHLTLFIVSYAALLSQD